MRLTLTPAEAGWVDWALGGPVSEWGEPEDLAHSHDIDLEQAQRAIQERDGTSLEGTVLVLPDAVDPEGDFVSDLLDMLENVARDVEDGYGRESRDGKMCEAANRLVTARAIYVAQKAAEKIRRAVGLPFE